MQRRTALGALASMMLAACGGGGSETGAISASPPPPSPSPSTPTGVQPGAFVGTRDIAAWGDSHTTGLPGRPDVPGYAAQLRQIAGARQVFVGGAPGLTSTQIADLQTRDAAHDDWINLFWYGGNNQTDAEAIKADLERSIASLNPGNNRFLVLGVTNQATPAERRGGADYGAIVQLNEDLTTLYGERFFDVREFLIGLTDPTNPADVIDEQDDVVPTSLRADGVHLNVAGSTAVARKVLELITDMGW